MIFIKDAFLLFAIASFILSFIQCRIFQTSMKFSNFGRNNGWIYLDKMTFAPGRVQISIRSTYVGIPYGSGGFVTLQIIPQQLWKFQLQRKCQDIPKEPYTKHRLTLSHSAVDYTKKQFDIQETTLFYIVLKDCQKQIISDYDNNNFTFKVKLHMKNNGRQLGQQQDHWYIVGIIFFVGFWLIYFYVKNIKGLNFKQSWHKMVMFAGIATQISSLTWKTIGFIIYFYSGADYLFFHVIYLFMHSLSESLVIGLIILIGFGWTINFQSSKNMQIYLPIFGCMAFVNTVLTLLTRLSTSQHDMHHIFDNISGHIIIGYRIILIMIFMFAILNTYQKSRSKVKNFIKNFAILGGIYILALPLIISIGNIFIQAKDRHQFVFVAIEALKSITNIGLSIMITYEKSSYNQVSYEKRSFLPEQSKYF